MKKIRPWNVEKGPCWACIGDECVHTCEVYEYSDKVYVLLDLLGGEIDDSEIEAYVDYVIDQYSMDVPGAVRIIADMLDYIASMR